MRTVVRLESGRLGIVIDQNPVDLLRPVVLIVRDEKRAGDFRPYRLDLLHETADRIVTYEKPEKYGLNVDAHLRAINE